MLLGYLLIALAGITLYALFRHQLSALLPQAPVGRLSWCDLRGITAFMLLFALTVFFSAPTNPLFFMAAGYLYGALAGTVIAVVATTIGSAAAFLFFRGTLAPKYSHTHQNLEQGKMLLMLTLLRSSPWFPSSLVNVFCGAIRVRPALFAASTVLGTIPLVSVYTLTASKLHGPLELSLLRSPQISAALFLMGALSLAGLLKPLRKVASHLRAVVLPLPARAGNT
jgi:uncharacterized membrane protein YdjX (TVP38/TMEM64 family)